ncbi:hypothetical protein GCM10009776_10940 [Microbacterium deminutum]|uniref:PH domain-containing protein n=1 Tax=Microbacterium deminutum TaxID=344164 RepID=A0ABN2QEH2_9MICO
MIVVVVVGLIALLFWAWRRRTRRDSALRAPIGDVPGSATVIAEFPSLYVATTRHGQPLERLAISGLGFRSKADVRVTDVGVALDLTGQPTMLLDPARITAVAQSTVAIDRVVEPDGLVCLSWRTDDGTVVDSYLRPQDASARALADAIRGILSPSSTGPDA